MTEFQHSVKVPRLYKDASRILKSVHEGGSLKDLVYNHNKFSNIKALHALVGESLKYDKLLSRILHSINILKLEKFDEWLAKVLLTELIFGKKRLPGNSKPILTLLRYQEDIEKQLNASATYNISSYSREKRKETVSLFKMPSVTVVIGYFFIYSMAMFSLPFAAFFGVRFGLRDYFGIDGFVNVVWSVIAAVLVVNLIILSYVIKAWHEPDPEVQTREDSHHGLKQD